MGVFVTSSQRVETTRWHLLLERLKSGVSRFIENTSNWMETHSLGCILLLVVLYVPLAVLEAHAHLITRDEIYTWHIAQAPTLHRMLAMTRAMNLHPPLHYLLQRWSLKLDLPRWLGSRLPNIVAGLITILVLFRLAARQYGNTIGMTAAAAFLFSPAIALAWENQPYMILLCALVLLICAWYQATAADRTWRSVACVLLASLAMVADHRTGVACLLPFAVGEIVRFRRSRRADWPLWLCLSAPALLGIVYQVRYLRTNSLTDEYLPSPLLSWNLYGDLLYDLFFAVAVCILALALMPYLREAPSIRKRTLRPEELAMLCALALLPIVTLSFGAMIGIAILIPWIIANRSRAPRTLSVFIVCALITSVIEKASTEWAVAGTYAGAFFQTGRVPMHLQDLDPSLPIVDASTATFIEMSDRESAPIVSRLYYLTDYNAALRYSGYNLFDNEEQIRQVLDLRSHTAKLRDFAAQHPRFYMIAAYPSSDAWLPRKLADSGVNVDYLGKFVSSYDNDDIFLVTIPPGALNTANDGFSPADKRVLAHPATSLERSPQTSK